MEYTLPQQVEVGSSVHLALNELQSRNLALDLASRMNSQLRPISWMRMVFLPLPIPSIRCQVNCFPFLHSTSLGVSHACSFTTP